MNEKQIFELDNELDKIFAAKKREGKSFKF